MSGLSEASRPGWSLVETGRRGGGLELGQGENLGHRMQLNEKAFVEPQISEEAHTVTMSVPLQCPRKVVNFFFFLLFFEGTHRNMYF